MSDADVRAAAEKAFGAPFADFAPRAGGHSSKNYRAVAADGSVYFVKAASPKVVARLRDVHRRLKTPLVPEPVFSAGGIIAFPWREGASVDPAEMTPGQRASVLAAVQAFHAASDGWIHGDFHARNFLFRGDAVTTVVDWEKARPGEPVDDLLRLFVYALERTRCWRFARLARLERGLAELVARGPFPAAAWLAALERYAAHKAARRALRKGTFLAALEKPFRGGLYRRLRRVVCAAKGGAPA